MQWSKVLLNDALHKMAFAWKDWVGIPGKGLAFPGRGSLCRNNVALGQCLLLT
jgi:hypothetical protein